MQTMRLLATRFDVPHSTAKSNHENSLYFNIPTFYKIHACSWWTWNV